MKKIIGYVLVLILLTSLCFVTQNNSSSAETQLKQMWKTEEYRNLEILTTIEDEVYIRYQAPGTEDVEYPDGYKNIIQSLDIGSGKFKWNKGLVSLSMINNFAGHLIQRVDNKIITHHIKEQPGDGLNGLCGEGKGSLVCLNPEDGSIIWEYEHYISFTLATFLKNPCSWGRVFCPAINTGNRLIQFEKRIGVGSKLKKYTLDIATGVVVNTAEYDRYPFGGGGYTPTRLLRCNGLNYWYSLGNLYCFDDDLNIEWYSHTSDLECFVLFDFISDIDYALSNEYIIVTAPYLGACYDLSTIETGLSIIRLEDGKRMKSIYASNFYVWENNLIYRESSKRTNKVTLVSLDIETLTENNWTINEYFRDFGRKYDCTHNQRIEHQYGNRVCYYNNKLYIQDTYTKSDKSTIHVYNLDSGEEIEAFTIDCEVNELFIVDCKLLALNWDDGILYCYELENCEKLPEKETRPECEPEPEPAPEPGPDPEPIPEPEPVIQIIKLEFQINRKSYILDDRERLIDASPVIQNGRTLLPARYVTEPLGGDVSWDATEKKVICILDDITIEMWIDNPVALVNGVEVQIDPHNPDVTPEIINDRTMVPMRFLAESLGCETKWLPDTREIILTYTP